MFYHHVSGPASCAARNPAPNEAGLQQEVASTASHQFPETEPGQCCWCGAKPGWQGWQGWRGWRGSSPPCGKNTAGQGNPPRVETKRWFGCQFLSELKVCELGAGVLRDFSQVNMRKLQKNQLQLIEHCSCGHISTTHPARWADSQLELQTAALRSKLRCGEL